MLEKTTLPNGDAMWKTDRGEARVSRPADTVVVVTVKGHSSMELYPLFVAEAEKLMASGRTIDWYADYSEMTSYDSDVRLALSEFTNVHKAKMDVVAVLVKSRIVSMGVTVASLATGGKVTSYADRAKFDASIAASVAKARGAASRAR